MPCLAQEFHGPKLPAAGHYCKSLSSLIRETYAHCHVPCVRIPGAAGWSSGDDSDGDSGLDEALETKQVILNEMRNRQMRKRSSRCNMGESPTLPLSSSAFAWSYTPLDPRTVLEKASSPKTCVLVEGVAEREKAVVGEEDEAAGDDGGDCDADDESEAFFSVKSYFTRSTSRAATVASSACMEIMDPPPADDAGGVGALPGLRGVAVRAVPPPRRRAPAAAAAQHAGGLVEVAQERQQPRREPDSCLHPQNRYE